jgi:hypothetical protein
LSLIELARLTDEQRAQLGAHGERWASLRLGGPTTDRAAAEDGVHMAYRAAGLSPPRSIVWGGGPVEVARAWARSRDSAGENVRALLIDGVRRKAESAVDRSIGLAVRTALAEERRLSRLPAFCTSVDEAAHRACDRVSPPLRTRLTELFALPYRKARINFASGGFSFHSTPALGALEYFHDVCGMRRHTEPLAGLWRVARQASWIVPHEQVCWLSERPELLSHDANGRLHAARGPALRYPDGWSAHAWKGVLVPQWIIERPELISVRAIANANDPQIRRCMIDVFTPQRFIAEGGAYRVSADETGILWRQRWRWEAWAAVEVRNGTPEPDGTYRKYFLQVPPTMRSAREAVAWTYGLSEQRYRPLLRT